MFHLKRIGPTKTRQESSNFICFRENITVIGRSPQQVDFVICSAHNIQNAIISRRHARVVKNSFSQHILFDDSRNGVFINDLKVAAQQVLNEGDTVTFGHPNGEKLKAGNRARQPDSEYQFIKIESSREGNRKKTLLSEQSNSTDHKKQNEFQLEVFPLENNEGQTFKNEQHIKDKRTKKDDISSHSNTMDLDEMSVPDVAYLSLTELSPNNLPLNKVEQILLEEKNIGNEQKEEHSKQKGFIHKEVILINLDHVSLEQTGSEKVTEEKVIHPDKVDDTANHNLTHTNMSTDDQNNKAVDYGLCNDVTDILNNKVVDNGLNKEVEVTDNLDNFDNGLTNEVLDSLDNETIEDDLSKKITENVNKNTTDDKITNNDLKHVVTDNLDIADDDKVNNKDTDNQNSKAIDNFTTKVIDNSDNKANGDDLISKVTDNLINIDAGTSKTISVVNNKGKDDLARQVRNYDNVINGNCSDDNLTTCQVNDNKAKVDEEISDKANCNVSDNGYDIEQFGNYDRVSHISDDLPNINKANNDFMSISNPPMSKANDNIKSKANESYINTAVIIKMNLTSKTYDNGTSKSSCALINEAKDNVASEVDDLATNTSDNLATNTTDDVGIKSNIDMVIKTSDDLADSCNDDLADRTSEVLITKTINHPTNKKNDDLVNKSNDDPTTKTSDHPSAKTGIDLTTLNNDDLATKTGNDLTAKSNNDLVTKTSDDLTSLSNVDLATKSSDDPTILINDHLATKTENDLTAKSNDDLATKISDDLPTLNNDDLATKTENDLTAKSNGDLATKISDDLTSRSNGDLATKTGNDLPTLNNDDLATKTENDLTAKSNGDLATKISDDLTSRSNDDLATKISDGLTAESNNDLATKISDDLTSRSNGDLVTKTGNDLPTLNNDDLATKTENDLTAKSNGDLATKISDDLTSRSNDDLATKISDGLTAENNNDLSTKISDDLTSRSNGDLATKTGNDLPTLNNDDLATKTGNDLPTLNNDDLATKTGNDLPTLNNDDLATKTENDLTAKSNGDLATKISDDLTSRSNGDLATKTGNDLPTLNNDDLATKTENDLTAKSNGDLATKISDDLTSRSNDDLATKTENDLTAKSNGDLATKISDDLTSRSNDDLATKISDGLTAESNNDLVTKTSDDLTTLSYDDLATKTESDSITLSNDDLATKTRNDLTAECNNDLATKTSDDLTILINDDVATKTENDLTAKCNNDLDLTSRSNDHMVTKTGNGLSAKCNNDLATKTSDDLTILINDDLTTKKENDQTTKSNDDLATKISDKISSKEIAKIIQASQDLTTVSVVDDMKAVSSNTEPNIKNVIATLVVTEVDVGATEDSKIIGRHSSSSEEAVESNNIIEDSRETKTEAIQKSPQKIKDKNMEESTLESNNDFNVATVDTSLNEGHDSSLAVAQDEIESSLYKKHLILCSAHQIESHDDLIERSMSQSTETICNSDQEIKLNCSNLETDEALTQSSISDIELRYEANTEEILTEGSIPESLESEHSVFDKTQTDIIDEGTPQIQDCDLDNTICVMDNGNDAFVTTHSSTNVPVRTQDCFGPLFTSSPARGIVLEYHDTNKETADDRKENSTEVIDRSSRKRKRESEGILLQERASKLRKLLREFIETNCITNKKNLVTNTISNVPECVNTIHMMEEYKLKHREYLLRKQLIKYLNSPDMNVGKFPLVFSLEFLNKDTQENNLKEPCCAMTEISNSQKCDSVVDDCILFSQRFNKDETLHKNSSSGEYEDSDNANPEQLMLSQSDSLCLFLESSDDLQNKETLSYENEPSIEFEVGDGIRKTPTEINVTDNDMNKSEQTNKNDSSHINLTHVLNSVPQDSSKVLAEEGELRLSFLLEPMENNSATLPDLDKTEKTVIMSQCQFQDTKHDIKLPISYNKSVLSQQKQNIESTSKPKLLESCNQEAISLSSEEVSLPKLPESICVSPSLENISRPLCDVCILQLEKEFVLESSKKEPVSQLSDETCISQTSGVTEVSKPLEECVSQHLEDECFLKPLECVSKKLQEYISKTCKEKCVSQPVQKESISVPSKFEDSFHLLEKCVSKSSEPLQSSDEEFVLELRGEERVSQPSGNQLISKSLEREYISGPSEDTPQSLIKELASHLTKEEYLSQSSKEDCISQPAGEDCILKPLEEECVSKPMEETFMAQLSEECILKSSREKCAPPLSHEEPISQPLKEVCLARLLVLEGENVSKPSAGKCVSKPLAEEHNSHQMADKCNSHPLEKECVTQPSEELISKSSDENFPQPSNQEDVLLPPEENSISQLSKDSCISQSSAEECAPQSIHEEFVSQLLEIECAVQPSEKDNVTKPSKEKCASQSLEDEHFLHPIKENCVSKPSDEYFSQLSDEKCTSQLAEEDHCISQPLEEESASKPLEQKCASQPLKDKYILQPLEEDCATQQLEKYVTQQSEKYVLQSIDERCVVQLSGDSISKSPEEECFSIPSEECVSQYLEEECLSQPSEEDCIPQTKEGVAQLSEKQCISKLSEEECFSLLLEEKCASEPIKEKCVSQLLEEECVSQQLEENRLLKQLKDDSDLKPVENNKYILQTDRQEEVYVLRNTQADDCLLDESNMGEEREENNKMCKRKRASVDEGETDHSHKKKALDNSELSTECCINSSKDVKDVGILRSSSPEFNFEHDETQFDSHDELLESRDSSFQDESFREENTTDNNSEDSYSPEIPSLKDCISMSFGDYKTVTLDNVDLEMSQEIPICTTHAKHCNNLNRPVNIIKCDFDNDSDLEFQAPEIDIGCVEINEMVGKSSENEIIETPSNDHVKKDAKLSIKSEEFMIKSSYSNTDNSNNYVESDSVPDIFCDEPNHETSFIICKALGTSEISEKELIINSDYDKTEDCEYVLSESDNEAEEYSDRSFSETVDYMASTQQVYEDVRNDQLSSRRYGQNSLMNNLSAGSEVCNNKVNVAGVPTELKRNIESLSVAGQTVETTPGESYKVNIKKKTYSESSSESYISGVEPVCSDNEGQIECNFSEGEEGDVDHFAATQQGFNSMQSKEVFQSVNSNKRKYEEISYVGNVNDYSDDENDVEDEKLLPTSKAIVTDICKEAKCKSEISGNLGSVLERIKNKRRLRKSIEDQCHSESPSKSSTSSQETHNTNSLCEMLSSANSTTDCSLLMAENQYSEICEVMDKLEEYIGHTSIRKNPKLAEHARVKAWLNELQILNKKKDLPKTIIAVVGDTGSGKSSLMNALLDHSDILPTSCMRACTAVVVEIIANTEDHRYRAEIDFLTEKEWTDELALLLTELEGPDGRVRARQPDLQSEAGAAWSKIRAVYGPFRDGVELQQLTKNNSVTRYLGKSRKICRETPSDFTGSVNHFIQSCKSGEGGEFWPIVKHVKLKIPNCDVCKSGAVLVDLPGIRDSNAARDKIARDFLKDCTAVWVVANIHRAIDDKTAKDLLGENFRRQLLMDGQYGSVSFICTKTDQIVVSEILRENPGNCTAGLIDKVERTEANKSKFASQLGETEIEIKVLTKKIQKLDHTIETMEEEATEYGDDISEVESVMKESNSVDCASAEEQLLELRAVVKEKNLEIAEGRKNLRELRQEKRSKDKMVLELEKQVSNMQREMASLCATARNEYIKKQIRKDFRAGLKEMKRQAGLEEDDDRDDDETSFSGNESEDEDFGLTVENLKVFCVSSNEYLKLQGKLPQDGATQTFMKTSDTGIPELHRFVHELTRVRKLQGTETLLRCVGQYVGDMYSYLSDEGTVDYLTRGDAYKVFEKHLNGVKSKDIHAILNVVSKEMDSLFNKSLKEKSDEGALLAAERANQTCKKWGSKPNKAKPHEGGLHFSTYKATVNRDGAYESKAYGPVDFNEDLCTPMYTSLMMAWDQVFNKKMKLILEGCKAQVLYLMKKFACNMRQDLMLINVSAERIDRVYVQHLSSASNKLRDTINCLMDFITERQRNLNRILTPAVQQNMLEAYQSCAAERGGGQFNRMKARLINHIDTQKDFMFDDASRQLLEQLLQLHAEVLFKLNEVVETLLQDLTVLYEPLWEAPVNSKDLRATLLPEVTQCNCMIKCILKEANIELEARSDEDDIFASQQSKEILKSVSDKKTLTVVYAQGQNIQFDCNKVIVNPEIGFSGSGKPASVQGNNRSGNILNNMCAAAAFGSQQELDKANMSEDKLCIVRPLASYSKIHVKKEINFNPIGYRSIEQNSNLKKSYAITEVKKTGTPSKLSTKKKKSASFDSKSRQSLNDPEEIIAKTVKNLTQTHTAAPQMGSITGMSSLALFDRTNQAYSSLTSVTVKTEPKSPKSCKRKKLTKKCSMVDLTQNSDSDSDDEELPPLKKFGISEVYRK